MLYNSSYIDNKGKLIVEEGQYQTDTLGAQAIAQIHAAKELQKPFCETLMLSRFILSSLLLTTKVYHSRRHPHHARRPARLRLPEPRARGDQAMVRAAWRRVVLRQAANG